MTKILNIKSLIILALNLIFISNIIAIDNVSTKVDSSSIKLSISNNIGLGFSIGSEIGPSLRYERENLDWGKLIINGQMLIYSPISSNILYDLGVGYGYPISISNKNALYLNGILTRGVHVNVKYGNASFCSGGLLEFEYRRTFGHFAIDLLPFFRVMYTFGEYKPDYSFTFSYGIKGGIMYRF